LADLAGIGLVQWWGRISADCGRPIPTTLSPQKTAHSMSDARDADRPVNHYMRVRFTSLRAAQSRGNYSVMRGRTNYDLESHAIGGTFAADSVTIGSRNIMPFGKRADIPIAARRRAATKYPFVACVTETGWQRSGMAFAADFSALWVPLDRLALGYVGRSRPLVRHGRPATGRFNALIYRNVGSTQRAILLWTLRPGIRDGMATMAWQASRQDASGMSAELARHGGRLATIWCGAT